MTIGFDGSRAFAGEKTGTENYSYQLLKALAKIDRKNQYVVYMRSSSVIARDVPERYVARRHHKVVSTLGVQSSQSVEDPHVGSIDPPQDDKRVVCDDGSIWPKNFQFKVIPWPRFWTQGGLGIQTFKDPLDVLFVPAHTLPLIRKSGLKTVVTVHDLGSEYLPSMHQFKQRLYLGLMQKFQLKTATRIIAVSKATKLDLVKKIGIDSEKIKVIYEGYNKEKFKYQSSNVKYRNDILVNSLRQYGLIPKEYFLFVGTVQPRKNLERLIKAFALHLEGEKMRLHLRGGLKLVIAGSKGWLSDEIYQLPKKLGIEERVKFLGYVFEKDLPALYSGAIALIFPSLFEGFGLPILEAQACGCPVLTSNISSMPEVAGSTSLKLRGVNDGAVYVNPYDVNDIVKGISRVKSQESRVKLIKAGLENVKKFSWEKCATQTLEALESLR